MPDLPTGTVTFLFTDIEGSTRLWEQHPAAMHPALARHDALLAAGIQQHGGVVVKSRGEVDSFFAVFPHAPAALAAFARSLPVQLTCFIGRERQMAEMKRLPAASHREFSTARAGGRAMTLKQALADALEDTRAAGPVTRATLGPVRRGPA
jgi:class 3 adenylate cyclase